MAESSNVAVRYHVNPDTGQPNKCLDGDTCTFGGDAFHYESRHDAQIAWQARQLERGVIAYRNVLRAKEAEEEKKALDRLAGKAKGVSKKLSFGVVRSVVMRNLTKYSVNFVGVFVAYAIASGRWLTEDWLRRLLPIAASVVLVALLIWFGLKFAKGSKKAAVAVKRRRVRRAVRRTGAP